MFGLVLEDDSDDVGVKPSWSVSWSGELGAKESNDVVDDEWGAGRDEDANDWDAVGDIGGGVSLSSIRRSTMTLALRIDTAASRGRR